MATVNGGAALGTRVGLVAAGSPADLIFLDLNHRVFSPWIEGDHEALLAHIVFAADGSCVHSVMVDGRMVVEAGELLTVDYDEVRREAGRCFRRLVDRVEAGG
jgi:cytosine/adenosine deaminase-related metal-dependent hydrolase